MKYHASFSKNSLEDNKNGGAMTTNLLTSELAARLVDLYARMEAAYERVAGELGFSCAGCPDNCCDSFFVHHTVIEWSYLQQGLAGLDPEHLARVRTRAERYLAGAAEAIARNQRPQLMCPLNEQGLCALYAHRLMICRMHGVPSAFTLPDGRRQEFPGCFRCQELTADRENTPEVDRTELYRELAELERELLTASGWRGPRVKMTIAEMILSGPLK
jgi:Fe-S-cluster containining protein